MEDREAPFQISPETKIGAMLEKFPKLEKALLEMAPEFKKLRNPILKKTVARVTSLKQAAAIAKIPVGKMINRLRREAGIQEEFASDEKESVFSDKPPSWFSPTRIVQRLDARPLIERGDQPVNMVFADCKNLKAGDIYELITPFLPAPLIDTAEKKGYQTWSKKEGKDVYKTYLTPRC